MLTLIRTTDLAARLSARDARPKTLRDIAADRRHGARHGKALELMNKRIRRRDSLAGRLVRLLVRLAPSRQMSGVFAAYFILFLMALIG